MHCVAMCVCARAHVCVFGGKAFVASLAAGETTRPNFNTRYYNETGEITVKIDPVRQPATWGQPVPCAASRRYVVACLG